MKHIKEILKRKKGMDKNEKGRLLDNLPEPDKGILTGRYNIDFYGCWWEVVRADKSKFWLIGEYPESL